MYINQIRRQAFYDLRTAGYSPIPMRRGAVRKPCIIGWTQYCERQATDDEIEYWVRTFPECNIAVCGGYNGLLILDIDDPAMVGDLAAILPTDTTGRFGSKGLAAFYRSSDTKARAFTAGRRAAVEFIGAGRNILVPPSVHETTGNPYTWVSPLRPVWELPELPADATRACYAALVRRYGAEACGGDPDRAALAPAPDQAKRPGFVGNLMRAWALGGLKREAERVAETPDGGRNRQLFASVCAVGKYVHHGVLTEGELTDVMMDACAENGLLYDLLRGGGPDAVRASITSGLDKSSGDALPDIGQPTPEEAFGAGPPPVPPGGSLTPISASRPTPNPFEQIRAGSLATPALEFKWAIDASLPPEEPELIERLLPATAGMLAAVVGVSGAGKSFYSTMQAVCLASGKPFLGQQMKHPEGVGVIYAAAEGEGTIFPRLHAARQVLGLDDRPLPFGLLTKFGNLMNPAERAAFVARVKAASQELVNAGRGPVRVLYIDTASTACAISDENSNSEIAAICKVLRAIGEEVNAVIVLLHHMGKNKERGMRGASAWRDNIDTGVSIVDKTVSILKDRNGPEGHFCHFELKEMTLGEALNQWGKPRVMAVFERVEAQEADDTFNDLDTCVEEAMGTGNNAKTADVQAAFVTRNGGTFGNVVKGKWYRRLKKIKEGKDLKYFMPNGQIIVRKTPETMNGTYGATPPEGVIFPKTDQFGSVQFANQFAN